jgi:hypothetical protein
VLLSITPETPECLLHSVFDHDTKRLDQEAANSAAIREPDACSSVDCEVQKNRDGENARDVQIPLD